MNISLLFNQPDEDSGPDDLDTLEQVSCIRRALNELGHQTAELHADYNLQQFGKTLEQHRGNLIFNLTDPPAGYGRFIALFPLILDQFGFHYTGCSADSLYMTSNKTLGKRILTSCGINTPYWIESRNSETDPFQAGKYIIKSVWEHGSVGLTSDSVVTVNSREELQRRFSDGPGSFFAEKFLTGREINIALLSDGKRGWTVLPPSEIVYSNKSDSSPFLDYSSKWDEQTDGYRNSSRSLEFDDDDKPMLDNLMQTARTCAALFRLKGYARVDFRMDENLNPFVLEVNANPCLSPGGGFAASAEKSGIGFTEMIRRIITAE